MQPSAEALFEEFLRRTEAGEALEFDAWCARHAQAAAELRALQAQHQILDQLFPGPLESASGSDEPPSAVWRRLRQDGPHGDRYQLGHELGRGGMGIVLGARDPDLGRPIAMKVMRPSPDGCDDPRRLTRFLDEAQITSQLDHPGIVAVHELGVRPDGNPYFTMRRVRGITLHQVFGHVHARTEGWNLMRAVDVLLRVCEAMSYAHGKRVIHRDLKPSNIMVGRFGEVQVMDWGLARVLDRADRHDLRIRTPEPMSAVRIDRTNPDDDTDSPLITADGDAVGTPSYMAPEQAMGQMDQLGPHTDVYSVGAMLYHLLSGEMPYVPAGARLSTRRVLDQVIQGPPRALAAAALQVPAELVAICDKAMARAMVARYPDMAALAADLRAFIERRVVTAYQTGPWAEARQWVRRNRSLAAALLAAVAALMAGAGFLVNNARLLRANDLLDTSARLAAVRNFGYQESTQAHGASRDSACQSWLAQARPLVAKLPRLLHDVREIHNKVRPVHSRVESLTASYPHATELTVKRAELRWRMRILNKLPWPSDAEVEIEQRRYRRPADPKQWNQEVFAMVRPDKVRTYDQERLALRLAEELVAATSGTPAWLPRFRDTLAFACFRVGQFDRAISEQERAVSDPQAETSVMKRDMESNLKLLNDWRNDWRNGRELELTDEIERQVQAMERELEIESIADGGEDAVWHEKAARLLPDLIALERRFRAAEVAAQDPLWPTAIAAIAAHPAYRGLQITPQLDLLPLGPDPDSGLWEFAHLPSGAPAHRGPDRRLQRAYDTGIVFVLLPGGPVPSELAVLEPETQQLRPFFLSKCELTRFQRERLDGRWPGPLWVSRAEGLFAANGMSPRDAIAVVTQAAGWMRLPTMLEWNYAARAGAGAWWTELTPEELVRHAGLTPAGYAVPGGLLPNAFGLHDMIGGFHEWCEQLVVGSNEALPRHVLLGGSTSSGMSVRGNHFLTDQGSQYRLLEGGPDMGMRPVRTLCR